MIKKIFASIVMILFFIPGCTTPWNNEVVNDVKFNGADLVPKDVIPFTLTNYDNSIFNMSDYEGKVVIVSFIFTECEDICPIITSYLKWVSEKLGDDYPNNVSILSITVDPWTDTPYKMSEYVELKNATWPHLSIADINSELNGMEKIWENFDVGLKIIDNSTTNDGNSSGRHHSLDYSVDHETATIIVDKSMQQRVMWGDYDWVPELVVEDVRTLLEE